MMRFIPTCLQKAAHTALANRGPLSDAIWAGTLNLETQVLINADAQLSAVVLESGTASTHHVLLSTTVRMCDSTSLDAGRVPTRSTCRCEKRRPGTFMGSTSAVTWTVVLPQAQS
jgi:hypothetical protein